MQVINSPKFPCKSQLSKCSWEGNYHLNNTLHSPSLLVSGELKYPKAAGNTNSSPAPASQLLAQIEIKHSE